MTRDSRSKPDRAETGNTGSVHESGGAEGNRPILGGMTNDTTPTKPPRVKANPMIEPPQDMGVDPAFAASQEEWLPVPAYEGLYEVSSLGRVRSLHRTPARILRPAKDPDGYPVVQLCRRGRTTIKLHRVVALAFHGDKRNSLHKEIAHLDGDRANAAARNLAWVSHTENHSHRKAHGTWPTGEKHPRARLTEEQVRAIRSAQEPYGDLADRFSVSWHTISDIKRGKRWRHVQ